MLSSEERKRLFQLIEQEKISAQDSVFLLLGLHTGIRACDAIKLKLSNIDWIAETFSFTQSKTGNPVTLPLTTDLGNAIVKYIPDSAFYGLDVITIDNSVYFTDIDGEILHYYASVSDPDIAAAAVNGNNTVIIPKAYGVTSVTVTAEDGLAARTSITFKIATANPNQPVTVQSSQVTDVLTLNIGSTESVSVNVQVYNASGARVLGSVFTASVFYPAQVDVSSLAPGRYSAIVKYGGNSTTVKFVKY